MKKVQSNIDSEVAISRNKLDIGDFVSTNLSVGLLVGFQSGMVLRELIVNLMAGLSIMMPHLGSFGLRIKYLLVPVRPS